jgi:AsmA protein
MRIAKIVLAVAAAVVALVIVGVVIVAWTFDPNAYKGVVTDQFTARTGRALTIDEDLRLAYFPWLAVETGGVTIGSSPSFGGEAQPFASARRVAARVKLLPLLSRRIEIGTVELDGLTLNLARDASLQGNWQDLVDAASTPRPAAPAEPAAAPARALAIEGIRITDGAVQWRENTDELRYSVTNLTLTTGSIGSGEPVAFDAALDFTNETSRLAATIAVGAVVAAAANGAVTATDVETSVTVTGANGAAARTLTAAAPRIAFDRTAETLAVEGLVTELAGIRAAWQLMGTTLLTNPTLRGSVAVAEAELATVFAQLGLSLPASVEPGELGTVALTAQLSLEAEPQIVQVSQVDAEIMGMHVTGEGSLRGGAELAGHVVVGEFTPNAAVQGLLRAAVPPTVDVSALGTLGLDAHFDTNLETGRAALRDFKLTALGATVGGDLEGLPGERGNLFRGRLATSRFAPDALAKAFAALLPANLAASELGMIELDTRFEFDSAADTVTAAPLRAEAFGLRASGEVTARNVSRAAVWTGTASVAQFSPQELLQRFGLPPHKTSDPQAFTRAAIGTRFTVTKDGAELDNLVLALDETTIKGTFALQNFAAPAYRFALDVDRVDADRYLPPKARDAQAGEQTAGDLELPQNNSMNLDGTMQVSSLKLAGMQFSDVGSRIFIGGGDMKLENARARLYGGSFAGNFHVRAAGSDPGLALDGRASGLELEPLIAALTGNSPNFSGTGSFDLSLAGKGRTITENVQTAGGNVSFDMQDGAIKGFNLGRALCSAYNVTQRAPAPPELPAVTAYEAMKGSAIVTVGTATSNDLLARTSFMDISGAGSLQLVEQQLDYELDAKLTAPLEIDNCQTLDEFVGGELPFRIKGTVTEPMITPDFSKLIRRQLREGIQDRLEDRIKDRLRDILR